MGMQDQPQSSSPDTTATGATAGETLRSADVQGAAAQAKKNVAALALAGDLGARNMEAMMSIARIAMGGMEALAQETVAQTRRSSEHAVEALRALADARTASDLLSVQTAYLKSRGQALLDQAALTQQITEKTSRALVEGCSAHTQEAVAGYTRIIRG